MLDSTKANEYVSQCANEVYSEVKICLNFSGITSGYAFPFLESSKQFSHYYEFRNYIYFSYTLTDRHLGYH